LATSFNCQSSVQCLLVSFVVSLMANKHKALNKNMP